jgi:phosphoribosyl-ATP pyrophosphohydrolase/phosphoribosyl-AMP cyclohydrolase
MPEPTPAVRLNAQGLVPAICQDASTGRVLMVAFQNREALARTLESGEMWFYSRSRAELWHKGETSGSYLHVVSAQADCDGDVLLYRVRPDGPACHTGEQSCFFTPLEAATPVEAQASGPGVLEELQDERPESSYTTRLFAEGTTRIAQKVAEEGAEVALAAAIKDHHGLPGEAADLLYHLLVLLADAGLSPEDVYAVLRKRQG